MLVIQSCPTLCDLVDYIACQAPLSMKFSRQEYQSGLPVSSPGDLPHPGLEPGSPVLQADSLPLHRLGSPPRSRCLNFLISWLQSPSTVNMEPRKIKFVSVSTFSPYLCREVMRPDDMILVFRMLSFKPAFHPHQEAFQVLFPFCHQSGIICMSEVVNISPGYLDPAFDSSSSPFRMMYSAYKLNKQGDSIWPCRTPFPLNQFIVPRLV